MNVKLNRKCFAFGFFLVLFASVFVNHQMTYEEMTYGNVDELTYFVRFIFLVFFIFLSNARLNDIGIHGGDKIFHLILLFIPLISLYPICKMIFKKGYEQKILDAEKNKFENHEKIFSLTTDLKKFWILTFLIISILICIFYVPYETKTSNGISKPIGNSTIFEPPKKYAKKSTYIIYEEIIFREFVVLVICGTGYLVSTMIKKK